MHGATIKIKKLKILDTFGPKSGPLFEPQY
jgi:hypothetical protein